nr:C1-like protein [Tanacetum cinerariifolium]
TNDLLHFPMSVPFVDPLKLLHLKQLSLDNIDEVEITHPGHDHPLILTAKPQDNNIPDVNDPIEGMKTVSYHKHLLTYVTRQKGNPQGTRNEATPQNWRVKVMVISDKFSLTHLPGVNSDSPFVAISPAEERGRRWRPIFEVFER